MSFVPRSVAKGKGDNRGSRDGSDSRDSRGGHGGRGNRGGIRGRGFRSRGSFNDRGRGRGMRGTSGMNRGRGGRGSFVPIGRAPVKILHPDDPDHPNFLQDKRNKEKVEQLIKEGRLDSSSLEIFSKTLEKNADGSDDGDHDEKLYTDDIFSTADSKFSDEGLRITVENKGGSETAVADPSFYDEIQPRLSKDTKESISKQTSEKKSRSKLDYENISDSDDIFSSAKKTKKLSSPQVNKSKKQDPNNEESIRITVGNDQFKSEDNGKLKNPAISKVRKKSPPPKKRSASPKQRYSSPGRRNSSSRRFSTSPRRSHSRRSPSPRRSPGLRRRKSRTPRRSFSRGARGHSRSPSPNRRRRSRRRSRSFSRERSWKSRSSSYSSYSSGRRSFSRSRSPIGPKASLPPRSKWDDSPRRSSRWDDSPSRRNKQKSVKPNPFLDFLRDLDYNKMSSDSAGSLPWMKDPSKAANVSEIEKYLESKLREANLDKKKAAEPNFPSNPPVIIESPRNKPSISEKRKKSAPGKAEAKELHPNRTEVDDIYIDIPEQPKLPSPVKKSFKSIIGIDDDSHEKKSDREQATKPSKSSPVKSPPVKGTAKAPIPGMASMMDIDDEDAFLYGDLEYSLPEPTVIKSEPPPLKIDPELEAVFTGGYSGKDPGWEVAHAKTWNEPDPIEPDSPNIKGESKEEGNVDPTIQNILKSIGFNFELSKLMQQKASQNRRKEEESYGIRQGSSFLGGSLKSADIKSALDESGKSKESRKIVELKESYEERARRYLEEQQKMYRGNVTDNQVFDEHSQSQDSQDFDPSRSPDRRYSHEDQEHYHQAAYRTDFGDFDMRGFQPQHNQNMNAFNSSSDKFTNDAGDGHDIRNQGQNQISALHQLQDFYHEERLREKRTVTSRAKPKESSLERNIRASDWERNSRESSRESSPQDSRRRKPLQDCRRQHSLTPDSKHTNDRKRSRKDSLSESALNYVDAKHKRRRSVSRDDSPPRSREPMRSNSPTRDKHKRRRSVSRDSESPLVKSKEANDDKKAHNAPNPEMMNVGERKKSNLTNKEREHLMYELEDRRSRLKSLDKELVKLRKQENELMRKQQRQRRDENIKLLDENCKLQVEIVQQISLLKNAAEVNAKLLLESRIGDPEEDAQLLAIIAGETAEKHKKTKKTEPPAPIKKPSPPPEKKSAAVKSAEEKVKYRKMEVHYEYFDPGNHWCKLCNHVSSNCYEVFNHLQTKKHTQKLDPYDRPWMPESLKNPTKPNVKGQSVAAPMKGVEFMMSVQAFYCSLCKEFTGDMICAEDHLKSSAHNQKYQKFLDDNQFYERRYNLDKAAGISMAANRDSARDNEEEDSHGRPSENDHVMSRRADADAQKREQERLRAQHEEHIRKIQERAAQKRKEAADLSRAKSKHHESVGDDDASDVRDEDKNESKPKQAFGNFKWKGKAPLIGKAPGFKKVLKQSSTVSKPEVENENKSAKSGKHATPDKESSGGVSFSALMSGSKKDKEKSPKLEQAEILDEIMLPALPPKMLEASRSKLKKLEKITLEEKEERKMLGIDEDESPKIAPRPPPPMALSANRPEQSMAATSAKKIYGVFFGSSDKSK